MVRIKICGITSLDDALAAARFGADALGFVFTESPRRVTPEQARSIICRLPVLVMTVGVFAGEPVGFINEVRSFCLLDAVQLHGRESEETVAGLGGRVIKALSSSEISTADPGVFPSATLLVDTHSPGGRGGTGRAFDWRLAEGLARRRQVILAGGLNPENVVTAIETVNPYAVDVSSGVESEPGRKDHEKLARFMRCVKSLDRTAR